MNKKIIIGVCVLLGVAIIAWQQQGNDGNTETGTAIVSVVVPAKFSARAEAGKRLFDENCASCHGSNAAGQDGIAPPFIHIIYEPSHHGDESFQRAAALGVQSHHWPFGDMPPVEGVNRSQVKSIIAYIRELQRANSIK